MYVANVESVRLLTEKQEEKSQKCDKLESENDSLKRSLEIKVWLHMYLLCSYFPPPSESSATLYNKKST